MRLFVLAAGFACLASSALAAPAAPLFPKPMHLVRRIDDPVARTTHVVDEYCLGNRVISVNGSRVAIVDYEQQQITELDHGDGTYSITPFAEVATARAQLPQARPRAAASAKRATALRPTALGRSGSLERYQTDLSDGAEKRKVEVGIDRSVALSKEAAEVLVGAAFPYDRTEEQDQILMAAAPAATPLSASAKSTATPLYGLPSESVMTYETPAGRIEVKSAVIRVDDELPSPQLLRIDPGARRIDSLYTRMLQELQELDKLPAPPARKQ